MLECRMSGQLDSKITKEVPHRIIPQDGKCPFITSEGLCSIHGTYGENLLSNTCKSYPRFVSEYGDLYIETLGLSCPAYAFLGIKKKVSLDKDSLNVKVNQEINSKYLLLFA